MWSEYLFCLPSMLQLQTFRAKATKTNKIKLLFNQSNLLYKLPRIVSYNRFEEPNLDGETVVRLCVNYDAVNVYLLARSVDNFKPLGPIC